jgi:hypothetical protein
VQSLLACRRLAASMGECWFMIEALVRYAADAIMVAGAEDCLQVAELPADGLRTLRAELAQEIKELRLEPPLLGERASLHWVLVEAPVGALAQLVAANTKAATIAAELYFGLPGLRAGDALFGLGMMDTRLAICSLPPREMVRESPRIDRDFDQLLREHRYRYLVSAMLCPALGRFCQEWAKARTRLQVARAALAVEEWRQRHGGWPDSLQQLVPELLEAVPEDIFSAGPIRYVKTETGVLLYGVGPDGKDNNGVSLEEATRQSGSGSGTEWDLPFRLLNPELRGARKLSFHVEVMGSGSAMDLDCLEAYGFDSKRLQEMGFSAHDISELEGR